ncbi:MAG: glucose-1-phosphate adenylyltransferase, partial [Chloroflexaceae bacterium]|nr:glucose-1-phosphate adenylyltransferase [Chloroflexaceae bacterium]
WQRGTADAVRYHLDLIDDLPIEDILILASDHIYKMDYRPLLQMHRERKADITLGVHSISPYEAYRYGVVTVDNNSNVTSFIEKPRRPGSSLASMGIYAFRKEFLVELLQGGSDTSFGRDILPRIINEVSAVAYNFQGYWVDVGTVQSYYEANMALLTETPALDMYDLEWVIHTVSSQQPGADVTESAHVENSLISDGSRVQGEVIRSIISPGVSIAPGAVVRDSIVLHNAEIQAGAVVDRCIIDEDAVIGEHALVGHENHNVPNQDAPEWLNTGLTLVGTRARVPAQVEIGRNVVIHPRTTERAFRKQRRIASGTTVGP